MGYVGLPLAIEFSKKIKCSHSNKIFERNILGFDINEKRLSELKSGHDSTNEVERVLLKKTHNLSFTSDVSQLFSADVFIITVPTPIDKVKNPDLSFLEKATATVGKALKGRTKINSKRNNFSAPIIIYESTVYPGATEEICIPILEKESNLKLNSKDPHKGFFCGYSPERINPGDKEHKISSITKVISGSDEESTLWINSLYSSIINAGTYIAPSIKVAEAAKVIENTQRDLNIALINELAIIFKKLGIDTLDVLEAASTKWNFMKFKPGLVGGHCIGVDPYYLIHKASEVGYHSQVILSGRKINDEMSDWVAEQLILELVKKNFKISESKIIVLGLTFKEDCPDLRNTRVVHLIRKLSSYGTELDIVDPIADKKMAQKMYGLNIKNEINTKSKYSAVLLTVSHRQFIDFKKEDWENLIDHNGIFMDLKGIIPRELLPFRL